MMKLADAVLGEAAALQACGVESVGVGVAGGNGFGEAEARRG